MDKKLLALYSLAHCWVDLSCALLVLGGAPEAGGLLYRLLLYNFCAFALQMPLGLLADRLDRNGVLAALGCGLTALAYLIPAPLPAAVTAGIGNALFHLGAGLDVLNGSVRGAAALGVFVSPGALGLYLGSLWSRGTPLPLWIAPMSLLALGGAVLLLCRRRFGPRLRSGNRPVNLAAPAGYAVLGPLLLVVVLRSYAGISQAFPWRGAWVLPLTLALVLGKAAGGFVMDRLGPERAAGASLGLAAALYLASALPLPGVLAVFFFNMTMPITLWAAARALPGAKGLAFGLLTFGLFLGFLPEFLGWPRLLTGPWTYAAAAAASLALLRPPLGALKRGARTC